MLIKAPFQLPAGFLPAFGYGHGRRYVALFWTACGDEACYDDGQSWAVGTCDNWLFLAMVRWPGAALWLALNGVQLGDSLREARHWLVVDSLTNEVYAAPRCLARAVVRAQALPA